MLYFCDDSYGTCSFFKQSSNRKIHFIWKTIKLHNYLWVQETAKYELKPSKFSRKRNILIHTEKKIK